MKAHECNQEVPDWDKDPLKKEEPVFISKHLDVTFGHVSILVYVYKWRRQELSLKSDKKYIQRKMCDATNAFLP